MQLQSLLVELNVKFGVRQVEQVVVLLHDEQFVGHALQVPFSKTLAGRQAEQFVELVQLVQFTAQDLQVPFDKKFAAGHDEHVVAFLQVVHDVLQGLQRPSTLLKNSVLRQGVHQPVSLVVPKQTHFPPMN